MLCKFNTVSEHISRCFVSLSTVVSHYLNVTFLSLILFRLFCMLIVLHWYTMLSFVDSKHVIVYFCIICKLIKKSFFFLMKMFIVWQKSSILSEYLVEVDFLRIYTHINIYCKSISFCFNSLRLSD